MVIDFTHLHIIGIENLIAILIGGIGMGVYFAYSERIAPNIISLIVLGWSFIAPLGLTQALSLSTPDVDVDRVIERMAMWALFSGITSGVLNFIRWRKLKQLHKV